MKTCKKCMSQNDDLSVYCSNCGAILDSGNTATHSDTAQSFHQQEPVNNYGAAQTNSSSQSGGFYNQGSNFTRNTYNPNTGYGYGGNSYQPMPQPKPSKGKVIAALIIGIVFGNLITIITSALALSAYGDWQSACRVGNPIIAQAKSDKVNSYNKVAWIFAIISIIFTVIIIAGGILLLFTGAVEGDVVLDDFFFESLCIMSGCF